jgi:hypothetical protein
MKIAIIGPGSIEIPPKGWGAVESLIHDYQTELKSSSWEVLVTNTRDHEQIARTINLFEPDFVHCQFDEHIEALARLACPHKAITSHFGHLDQVWRFPEYLEWSRLIRRYDGVVRELCARKPASVQRLATKWPRLAVVTVATGRYFDLFERTCIRSSRLGIESPSRSSRKRLASPEARTASPAVAHGRSGLTESLGRSAQLRFATNRAGIDPSCRAPRPRTSALGRSPSSRSDRTATRPTS